MSETSDGNYVFCCEQLNQKLSLVEFSCTYVISKEIVQNNFIKKLDKFDLCRPMSNLFYILIKRRGAFAFKRIEINTDHGNFVLVSYVI